MDKLSASEALFGFMGWLTSLETPVTFSGHHEAGIGAQLVGEYCKANGLAEPREGWYLNLVQPSTSRPTKRAVDLGWVCAKCGCSNIESDLLCGFCNTPRPSD